MSRRRTPATPSPDWVQFYDARLQEAHQRVKAGDWTAVVEACHFAIVRHLISRQQPDEEYQWSIDSTDPVTVPAWVLLAAEELARLVLTEAPGLLGGRGRHARPARKAADKRHDLMRTAAIRAGMLRGLSMTAAFKAASDALRDTPAAGTPRVMEQAWARAQVKDLRISYGERVTFHV